MRGAGADAALPGGRGGHPPGARPPRHGDRRPPLPARPAGAVLHLRLRHALPRRGGADRRAARCRRRRRAPTPARSRLADGRTLGARFVVDAAGWRRVLDPAGPLSTSSGGLSFGAEEHVGYPDARQRRRARLRRRPRPSCAAATAGTSPPATTPAAASARSSGSPLQPPMGVVREREELGAAARKHGGAIPHRLRSPVAGGILFVGDAAGHCLPLSAEGIRAAVYFGTAAGRLVRASLRGELPRTEALRRYAAIHEREAGTTRSCCAPRAASRRSSRARSVCSPAASACARCSAGSSAATWRTSRRRARRGARGMAGARSPRPSPRSSRSCWRATTRCSATSAAPRRRRRPSSPPRATPCASTTPSRPRCSCAASSPTGCRPPPPHRRPARHRPHRQAAPRPHRLRVDHRRRAGRARHPAGADRGGHARPPRGARRALAGDARDPARPAGRRPPARATGWLAHPRPPRGARGAGRGALPRHPRHPVHRDRPPGEFKPGPVDGLRAARALVRATAASGRSASRARPPCSPRWASRPDRRPGC